MHLSVTQPGPGKGLRRWGVALLALGALPAAGCDRNKPTPEAARPLTPVAAPPGLVAELYVAHPNTTWARVRDMVGGPLKFLPAGYPMLVASMLGLPPAAADQIDPDVPTVGAATSDGKSEVPVLAIHVKDGKQMVQILTAGAEARYTAKPDAPSMVTILEPKAGQTSLAASIGVTGNYLLVGYAPDGLLKVGPYAARTLGPKPPPPEDAVIVAGHEGLAGPLKTRLSVWWGELRRSLAQADQDQRDKHGGSAPSFGDPQAALQKADTTFQGLFALMGDLSEGRITLKVDDAGAHLRTTLKPQGPEGVAAHEFGSMKVGDASALLDLPASATVGLLTRDSTEGRERSANDQGEALEKMFAGKLGDDDKKRLRDVLASWSKGRGDWLVVGGKVTQGDRTLFARSAIADADTLDRGIRTSFELTRVPALAEPLRHWLGDLKISAPTALEGTRGAWTRIERQPPVVRPPGLEDKDDKKPRLAGKGEPKDIVKEDKGGKGDKAKAADGKGKEGKGKADKPEVFEVAWSFDKDTATYVMGRDAKAALAEYTGAAGPGTLRSEEEVKAMVDSLGSEVSFALVVLPLRLVGGMLPKAPTSRPPAAPITISFGRSAQNEGWFRFDAAPAALRELVKVRSMD